MTNQPIDTLAAEMGAAAEAADKGLRWEKAEHDTGAVVLTIDGDADDQGRCIVTTEVIAKMEDSTEGDEIADYLVLVQPAHVRTLLASRAAQAARLAEIDRAREERADAIAGKSLGEKLFLAMVEGEDGYLWSNVKPKQKAAYEKRALAFAASLTHDETASAVIADLSTRLAESEARETRLVEAALHARDDLGRAADLLEHAGHREVAMRTRTTVDYIRAALQASARKERANVLDWLAENRNCELSYHYGDADEDGLGWCVHAVHGNVNDREWTLIGNGATPDAAIRAALTLKGGS